ncbi:multicopper oxidase family protein [Actinoallomurus sp. CA-150999]|uniref:multicopper oxidase family protein n=1 Tax=Actinoallomurus sp. CA-150999 TaxID=3239887 RepID=UPI003D8E268B
MPPIDRRAFLRTGLTASGMGLLAACGSSPTKPRWIQATDSQVKTIEAARRTTGRTRTFTLNSIPVRIDLGGPTVTTWTYGGALPGREIRVRAGDVIEARLVNHLPADTTVHWHGLALRNDMDGAPDLTQSAVKAGQTFSYRFVAENPGTYWFHPHTGVQLDRGLYAPLIVEDPSEPGAYDDEWTVVLDDWIDGTGNTPDQVLTMLRKGMGDMSGMDGMDMGPMLMGAKSDLLGGDAGDVKYPHYLINGRVAAAPVTFRARPRRRVRLRLINAGSDTAFRVALGGHRMRVTHNDGFPVVPVDTDALLIGMGERYDVVVTLDDGVFPLTAIAEGKGAAARALIRTGSGDPPSASARPRQLTGKILGYADLRPADQVRLAPKKPDIEHRLDLTGSMMHYNWAINGRPYDPGRPLPVRSGERVRITFRNRTTMWHPMHIHGHTFQINGNGPRKDTVIVLPNQTVTCDFDADNPGQWMSHCHNAYHLEAGMMTVLGYRV